MARRATSAAACADRRGRHGRAPVSGNRRGARTAPARPGHASCRSPGTARGIEARVLPREGLRTGHDSQRGTEGQVADRAGARPGAVAAERSGRVARDRRGARPHVVIGVGGYSSGPDRAAGGDARHRHAGARAERGARPDEPPAGAGSWTRRPSRTRRRCAGFRAGGSSAATRCEPGSSTEDGRRCAERRGRRVLVFGGSQGAQAINEAMVAAAPRLARATPAVELTHQTGERDAELVRAAYAAAGFTRDGRAVPPRDGARDGARGPRGVPRRRDDARRVDGGRAGRAARAAADGDRRPPAQERRGAGSPRAPPTCWSSRRSDGRGAGGSASSPLLADAARLAAMRQAAKAAGAARGGQRDRHRDRAAGCSGMTDWHRESGR